MTTIHPSSFWPARYWLLSSLLFLIACSPSSAQSVALEPVAEGFDKPLFVTHAGDGSGRLFVVEQGGTVRIVENGQTLSEPFLDVSNLVSCCGERGLLGLAFHPEFEQNGLFYINYTGTNGDTVVAERRVSENPNRADSGYSQTLLDIVQPYANHNGGHLAFGLDGYLYIGMGDGGSGGDPEENGQDLSTLLGAILRIDVDGDPYTVPDSNPFVDTEGARPEIWAYGLRNPWRFSFDHDTGDLWIGDVGQNAYEEIDFQPGTSTGGENYGWDVMEGAHCFEPENGCDRSGLVLPLLEYSHSVGRSITGGYRYRGEEVSSLSGAYLFGDFAGGQIWGARQDDSGAWRSETLLRPGFRIASFGEDEAGEVYVVDYGGTVHRIVEQ